MQSTGELPQIRRSWRRSFGWMVALVLLGFLAWSLSKHPVSTRPSDSLVIGTWECKELPQDFLARFGPARACRIVIQPDGTLDAQNFPQGEPFRYVNFTQSHWTLTAPHMTPAGIWSVEFEGIFLRCWVQRGELILRLPIRGVEGEVATYRKVAD